MRTHRHISFRGALLASTIALATIAAFGVGAQTYDYWILHNFSSDEPGDGINPTSTVQFDAAGNLYGTTIFGGAHHEGTIFKIARSDGAETILHSFEGISGNNQPPGGVTIDPETGDLYGTTQVGLYKLAVDGTFTVLHALDYNTEGGMKFGGLGSLLRDSQGNLYGTAPSGGPYGAGTVFKYGADGSFTVLHAFTGIDDGATPVGGLISDSAGNLYGVAAVGGRGDCGTIYMLASDGTFRTLHSFKRDGSEGRFPSGPLVGDQAGNLYGVTASGEMAASYGTVYRLAPNGAFNTLHFFSNSTDGAYPIGPLVRIRGNLYGVTSHSGEFLNPYGVVFKLGPDGTFTALHNFSNLFRARDGYYPQAGLAYNSGRLFGTTYWGGQTRYSFGTVYSVGVTNP